MPRARALNQAALRPPVIAPKCKGCRHRGEDRPSCCGPACLPEMAIHRRARIDPAHDLPSTIAGRAASAQTQDLNRTRPIRTAPLAVGPSATQSQTLPVVGIRTALFAARAPGHAIGAGIS